MAAAGAGNVLNGLLTPGPAGDCPPAAGRLAPALAPAWEEVADPADDREALRGLIAAAGARAGIPANPRRRNWGHVDPCAYASRHHIEQTVNTMKQHRRIAPRHDNPDASFDAFVCAPIVARYLN